MDPPPSSSWALGTVPDATIAAEALEDAPLENSVCQGLRTGFPFRGSVVELSTNSEKRVTHPVKS